MSFLFAKKKTAAEQAREWTSALKKEQRRLDSEMRKIQREMDKIKIHVKKAAKEGNDKAALTMAKSMIQANRGRNRLLEAKTRINSTILEMKSNMATIKVTGAMQQSSRMMAHMSAMIKLPEIAAMSQNMAREMMKTGIIQESIEDCFDSLDDDELVEEADEEVAKVLFEITAGQLGKDVGEINNKLKEAEVAEEKEEVAAEDVQKMMARLNAL